MTGVVAPHGRVRQVRGLYDEGQTMMEIDPCLNPDVVQVGERCAVSIQTAYLRLRTQSKSWASPVRFEVRPPFGGQDFKMRFTAAVSAAQGPRTPCIGPVGVVIDVKGPYPHAERDLHRYGEIVTKALEGLTYYAVGQVSELTVRRAWQTTPRWSLASRRR